MRITFTCSTTETLAYLRTVETIQRSNASVEESVKAFRTLKEGFESLASRLEKLETEASRRHACR